MLTATFDTRQFDAGMRAVRGISSKTLLEQCRQRSLNLAGRSFDLIPPLSGPGAPLKRATIKAYLSQQLATRIGLRKKRSKTGAIYKQKGAAGKQLQRVHLIAQHRAKLAGKKGLYGPTMSAAASKLRGTALKSVGFLKSVFLPIITTLNPLCKFKFPFRKTKNISRWPGSAGHGSVSQELRDMNPAVLMNLSWNLSHDISGNGQTIIRNAIQLALNLEGREMAEHARRTLQKRYDEHPALKRKF